MALNLITHRMTNQSATIFRQLLQLRRCDYKGQESCSFGRLLGSLSTGSLARISYIWTDQAAVCPLITLSILVMTLLLFTLL